MWLKNYFTNSILWECVTVSNSYAISNKLERIIFFFKYTKKIWHDYDDNKILIWIEIFKRSLDNEWYKISNSWIVFFCLNRFFFVSCGNTVYIPVSEENISRLHWSIKSILLEILWKSTLRYQNQMWSEFLWSFSYLELKMTNSNNVARNRFGAVKNDEFFKFGLYWNFGYGFFLLKQKLGFVKNSIRYSIVITLCKWPLIFSFIE